MDIHKQIISVLGILWVIQPCFVYGSGPENSDKVARIKRSEIEERCGISLQVPPGLKMLVVPDSQLYPKARCILGVREKGRTVGTVKRETGSRYSGLVDFVLTVKEIPVQQRLMEYGFSTIGDSDGAVKYIGQTKSEIATQMGYLGETTDSWSITSQGGGTLYAAEVSSFRSISNRSPVRYHRMHLLWGNEKVSVGAIVVCTPSKPRDCKLQDNIREMFGTISDVDYQ
ncbi:hypothetical protein SAMN04488595_11054 [Ralstonia sp. 25mfcol4.1]|uniref:hypothetical protein n=1 Tax=Burkholderiaceae TaxID=119060 RepID=UPI00088D573D|nr:hypothetical protein [Ralstonia sp. 25mfcol4.1]SDP49448.1 hypothetical protein SAMN04488595_11054 [Ralstonia sp. 25mfcol4.1]